MSSWQGGSGGLGVDWDDGCGGGRDGDGRMDDIPTLTVCGEDVGGELRSKRWKRGAECHGCCAQ